MRRIMRLKEVMHVCGISRSTVYSWVGQGQFPQHRRIGGRSVGWDSEEIERWVNRQLNGKEVGQEKDHEQQSRAHQH
ncbi:helix-turn-helix transcriptional regulator [Pseudomonas sp. PDM11]|uniref:helix-turn-helix transcriptional regulator n=1 Tax=Pseudomonas sp. PDM11 TaxID=2769309 RepID=UPI0017806C94|nr:AlpA family transcriptional regulator [Pseudomonas sp. PDM11]MBD9399101.1 AlpA family transcriptional regulator [Pseudomonas sp. PDM11]